MSQLLFSDLPSNTEGVRSSSQSSTNNKIIWIMFFMFGVSLATLAAATEELFAFFRYMFVILIISAVVYGIYLTSKRKQKLFEDSFAKFLAANKFEPLAASGTPDDRVPFIYGLGYRNEDSYCFSGKLKSIPFTYYTYTYFRKTKNSERAYPFTVFRFSLSKSLPHLVLDSRKNDGIISSIPRFFNDEQRIELEGNFNDYFDLFAPRDYEIEALDILSPDFMQMLMDFHTDFDVEINKTEVYLISKGVNYDQQTMQEAFTAAEVLIDKFNHKLKAWSMAAMAKNLPELDSHIDESAIRIGGKRISTAVFTIPLISLYLAARISESGFNIWVFTTVFAVSVVVLVILRKRKLKRN